MVGCALAALPGIFAALLAGRGLQGIGLGLMPLAMTVARDHLAAERSHSAVAVLSITASAGVGLGYPLTGLLADRYGFHAPFGSVWRSVRSPSGWPPWLSPAAATCGDAPSMGSVPSCSAPD